MDAGRWTVGVLMSGLSLAFADAPIPRNLASVGWELGTAGANMYGAN